MERDFETARQACLNDLRVMRKAIEMIEVDLRRDDQHVDDRDEAYSLTEIVQEKARQLVDKIGNLPGYDD